MARKPKATTQQAATVPTLISEQRYFRIAEAAEYLRTKQWTIAAAIRGKKLPHLQMGKRYVLLREDLDAFAAGQRVEA